MLAAGGVTNNATVPRTGSRQATANTVIPTASIVLTRRAFGDFFGWIMARLVRSLGCAPESHNPSPEPTKKHPTRRGAVMEAVAHLPHRLRRQARAQPLRTGTGMPSLRGVPPGNTLAMPRPARSNHSSPAGSALSICKGWQVEYPWDVRAEKIGLALPRAGHHVNLVARNRTS